MNDSAIQVTFRVLCLFEGCQTSVFHLKNQQPACTKGEQDSIQGLGMKKVKIVGSLCDRISSKPSCEGNDMYFIQH